MSKNFVTETIQESIPLIVVGDTSGSFVKKIVEAAQYQPEGFSPIIISFNDLQKHSIEVTPYAILAVLGFKKDGDLEKKYEKGRECLFALKQDFSGVPIIIVLSSTASPLLLGKIRAEFASALILRVEYSEEFEASLAGLVLRTVVSSRKATGLQDIIFQGVSDQSTHPNMLEFSYNEERPQSSIQIKKTVLKEKPPETKSKTLVLFSHLPQERSVSSAEEKKINGLLEGLFHEKNLQRASVESLEQREHVEKEQHKEKNRAEKEFVEKKQVELVISHQGKTYEEVKRNSAQEKRRLSLFFQDRGKKTQKRIVKLFGLLGIGFIIFLFSSVAVFIFAKKQHLTQVNSLQTALKQEDWDSVKTVLTKLGTTQKLLQFSLLGTRPMFLLFQRQSFLDQVETGVRVVEQEIQGLWELGAFSSQMSDVYSLITEDQEGDVFSAIQEGVVRADDIGRKLSLALAEINQLDQDVVLFQDLQINDIKKSFLDVRKNLLSAQHFFSIFPEILGKSGKKTYAVLFQNPLELRATGGFLSTVGFITIDKGKLLDIQFQDSYTIDSQLHGKVVPPEDLQKYLGEEQWYLRDSNWSGDFQTAAEKAEWFIEKELGKKVDGSIGMNAYVLQKLLTITGPVTVASYSDEQVSSENIFERLQTRTEWNFSLKNQTKREYITELVAVVFDKLTSLSAEQSSRLGKVLLENLDSSQLFLRIYQKDLHNIISSLGWDGKIMTPLCPQQFSDIPCSVDTLYVVESNVGVNRANYYIERTANHDVVLDSSRADHTHLLTFTNKAVSTAWPSGAYKNYIRMYVPLNAQVENIIIDDIPVSDQDVYQTTHTDKKIIGFRVDVPVGESVSVKVHYAVPLADRVSFSYAFFSQKQSGIDTYPMMYSIAVLSPLHIVKIAPEARSIGNTATFNTEMEKHQYMAVEVKKEG